MKCYIRLTSTTGVTSTILTTETNAHHLHFWRCSLSQGSASCQWRVRITTPATMSGKFTYYKRSLSKGADFWEARVDMTDPSQETVSYHTCKVRAQQANGRGKHPFPSSDAVTELSARLARRCSQPLCPPGMGAYRTV